MLTASATSRSIDPPHARHRRGVAMLLVLISLMCATVVTAAYLASRDNSAAIGDNVANAAAARWSAASALNMGIAMLETESDWRTTHNNGLLLDQVTLAQTELSVSLMDLETQQPPTASTTYVRLLATGNAGDVEHEAAATLIVPVPNAVSFDLSEFAVFVEQGLQMSGSTEIARWPSAPLSDLKRPIALGMQSTGFGAMDLGANALAVDAVAWLAPGASTTAVSNASVLDVDAVNTPDLISLPASPSPDIEVPEPAGSPTPIGNLNLDVTSDTVVPGVQVIGATHLHFEPDAAIAFGGDLRVAGNITLGVSGDATMVVAGDLIMEIGSSIRLSSGHLRLYVGGEVRNNGGYIGELGGTGVQASSSYTDLGRVRIFSLPGAAVEPWSLRSGSVIRGHVYAPTADITMENSATVVGRIAARSLSMSDQAMVYYDHALDRRIGYTTLTSAIYDGDGRVRDEFRDIPNLNDATLLTLVGDTLVNVVSSLTGILGNLLTAPEVDGDDPTPRTVEVGMETVEYDVALASWEQ